MNYINPDSLSFLNDTLGVIATNSVEKSINPTPSFGIMMLQMILVLLLISVVLYIALYFFKKINYASMGKNSHLRMKLHENLYLSQKQGVSVVQYANKLYIIGFSQNSVNLIDKIEDPELVTSLTTEIKVPNKFGDMLSNYFSKNKH